MQARSVCARIRTRLLGAAIDGEASQLADCVHGERGRVRHVHPLHVELLEQELQQQFALRLRPARA